MENNNSNNKGLIIVIVCLVVIALTGGVYLLMDKDNKLDNLVNNTDEELDDEEFDDELVDEEYEDEESNNTSIESKVCYSSYNKVFSSNGFTIYKNPNYKGEEDDGTMNSEYCLINDKTGATFVAYKFYRNSETSTSTKIDNYFFFGDADEDEDRGIFNLSTKKLMSGLGDYSCEMHTDESAYDCEHSYTTIVAKYLKDDLRTYGVISLSDYSTILPIEYNVITEDDNGNFLVSKNNKYGLYSSAGKELFKVEYDYLGFNEYLGYITIKGDVVEYYNTRLVKQSIQEDTLKNAYKTALENYNKKNKEEKLDYLELMMADSYNWSVGTNMKIHTMSEPFDKDSDGLYRYKYKGKNITGEQLVIYSTCFGGSDEFIYVINGNKATKITSKELDIPNDEDGNFCF